MIKSIIILIQFLALIYILQIANAESKVNRAPSQITTVPTQYESLLEELISLRKYNFSLCFSMLEVKNQNDYCWGYQILDVVLHGKTEDLIDEIIKERENGE